MAKKQIEVSIESYLDAVRRRNIRVKRAILYGSQAAGTAHRESDVDLAIISPDLGHDRFDEAILLKELTFGIDLDISPRPYSVEHYEKAKRGDFLYDEIIRKGKTVYEE